MLEEILVGPTVNINGTSRRALLAGYIRTLEALRRTETELREIAPHGRDYPCNAPAFLTAREQHCQQLAAVENIIRQITKIAEKIA